MSRNEKIQFIIDQIWIFKGIKHDFSTFSELTEKELDEWIEKIR